MNFHIFIFFCLIRTRVLYTISTYVPIHFSLSIIDGKYIMVYLCTHTTLLLTTVNAKTLNHLYVFENVLIFFDVIFTIEFLSGTVYWTLHAKTLLIMKFVQYTFFFSLQK